MNYELEVRVCEGTEEEKLSWFRTINIAGVTLTNRRTSQCYVYGYTLLMQKIIFQKRNCVAGQMADGYIKGNLSDRIISEKALLWTKDRDNLDSVDVLYMAIHQHDLDANDLWLYFQTVINWAKMLFPGFVKE